MILAKIGFLIVVFLSNIIQCVTGFAGTVLAMPFSIMLVGFGTAKPILNVLGIAASVGVVIQHRKVIRWPTFGEILAVALPGMALGTYLRPQLIGYEVLLYKALGLIVLAFDLMNVISPRTKKPIVGEGKAVGYPLLALGGAVHGVFTCGGPLIVTYASVKLKENEQFSATLSMVWIVLNSIMFITDLAAGCFVRETNQLLFACLALLLIALRLGHRIAEKLSRKSFMVLTDTLMAISGVSLLVK